MQYDDIRHAYNSGQLTESEYVARMEVESAGMDWRVDPCNDTMINQVMGRCYTGLSYCQAIRFVISKLEGGRGTFLHIMHNRRLFLKNVCAAHRGNRGLYSLAGR